MSITSTVIQQEIRKSLLDTIQQALGERLSTKIVRGGSWLRLDFANYSVMLRVQITRRQCRKCKRYPEYCTCAEIA